jgi:hypothetical protein
MLKVKYFIVCRHQSGDGHQLLRHCEHSSGIGHDEILEGEAHHTEETGKDMPAVSRVTEVPNLYKSRHVQLEYQIFATRGCKLILHKENRIYVFLSLFLHSLFVTLLPVSPLLL